MTSRFAPPPDDPAARPVHHVADGLAVVAARLGLGDPRRMAAALSAWPEVVGPAVAAHTRARALRDGALTVEVDGPEWTTQLRYLETDLVARLADRVGPGLVTSIRLVVRPSR